MPPSADIEEVAIEMEGKWAEHEGKLEHTQWSSVDTCISGSGADDGKTVLQAKLERKNEQVRPFSDLLKDMCRKLQSEHLRELHHHGQAFGMEIAHLHQELKAAKAARPGLLRKPQTEDSVRAEDSTAGHGKQLCCASCGTTSDIKVACGSCTSLSSGTSAQWSVALASTPVVADGDGGVVSNSFGCFSSAIVAGANGRTGRASLAPGPHDLVELPWTSAASAGGHGSLKRVATANVWGMEESLFDEKRTSERAPQVAQAQRAQRASRNSVRTSSSSNPESSEQHDECDDRDITQHVLYGTFKEKLEDMSGRAILTGRIKTIADFAVQRGWIDPYDEEEDEQHRRKRSLWTRFCQHITSGNRFEFVCVAAIFLNTIFIGAVTQYEATSPKDTLPVYFKVVSLVFTCWFFGELSVRFGAEGLLFFIVGPQWRWNFFDSIIVSADLVQLIMESLMSDENPLMENSTAFRILRLLRVCRVLRVIKFIHFFKNFRIMVMAFVRSGWTLFWALLLLFMIIYVFSIYITQNVTAYLRDYPDPFGEVQSNLSTQFGSLEQAGYTLFKSIAGGVSWEVVSDSLFYMDTMSGIGFVIYIFFTVFSLLNIITGIFVDTAISSAQNDDEEVIQAHMQSQDSTVRQLTEFFKSADLDSSGAITLPELEYHFQSQRVAAQFATMGINVGEARSMFMMLDADGSGSISIDEFVFGCLRMKGTARSLDLQALMFENKKMIHTSCRYYERILKEVKHLAGHQDFLNSRFSVQESNARDEILGCASMDWAPATGVGGRVGGVGRSVWPTDSSPIGGMSTSAI